MYQLFGDKISSSTRLLVGTVSALTPASQIWVRWRSVDEIRQDSANLGGTDGRRGWVFVCWGAIMACLQQGARWSSSPALDPLPASAHKYAETTALVWILCPSMCLHECLLWSPQKNCIQSISVFGEVHLILPYWSLLSFVILASFFPPK